MIEADEILSESESIEMIDRWLRAKHVTLWQSWDLTSDDRRYQAAKWLYDTLNDLLDYIEQEENVFVVSSPPEESE